MYAELMSARVSAYFHMFMCGKVILPFDSTMEATVFSAMNISPNKKKKKIIILHVINSFFPNIS